MSDDQDAESKTEEPTEKRLHEALERGDMPVSREVAVFSALAAMLIVASLLLPTRALQLTHLLRYFIDNPSGWSLRTPDDALALLRFLGLRCAAIIWPIFLVFMAFNILPSLIQNPPRFVPNRIAPKWSRLSVRSGAARIFGLRGMTEFGKSSVKLAIALVAAFLILRSQRYELIDAMTVDVIDLPRRILSLVVSVIGAVMAATLVIACADFAWSRILWRRDQRMTKQEIKEELKQLEGDRLMKARLRSIRLDRSRKRMLAAVPRATMVIANPTHYAVALRYVREEGGAPIVLAKGMDLIALKIREVAEELNIPIVEDKPLARSLYKAVVVDQTIPQEFYRAVAEIVHILQTRKSAWPLMRHGAES